MPAANTDTHARTNAPVNWHSAALALTTAALWGGNAVATRFAVDAIAPFYAAGARFILASLFMLAWCGVERCGVWPRREQIRPVVIIGVLMFLQIGTFNYGTRYSNASHAVLIVNAAVFWVMLYEHFFTQDHRLTLLKTTGVVVACAGTFLLIATTPPEVLAKHRDEPTLLGDAILLASSVFLGVKILYTRRAVRTVEPGKLIFWHNAWGAILLLMCAATFEPFPRQSIGAAAVWALFYQGVIVGGVCFAVNAVLLRRHAASRIAVFAFIAPLFGVFLAQWVRSDPLSPWLMVAAVCIAGGIVLVNVTGSTAGDPAHSPDAPIEQSRDR